MMHTKFLIALIGLMLVGCATAPTPAPQPTAPSATLAPRALTEVTVVMGYIPNVQFAPFYVADQKGFFAEQGIKIKYSWGFEVDGVKLVGAGQADFAMLGGDQVLQAREKDIPLVYIANYYNAFPISIFGKKIGLPGFFGATYTGWRALLYEANLKESDVKVQDIGFAQIAALDQGLVDAAAGYANNEPVQLRLAGKKINVINVGEYSRLVGIGLVTNEKTAADKPQIVRAVVSALMRGIQEARDKPDDALEIVVKSLPEAGGQNLRVSQAVLRATAEFWKNPRLGFVDPAHWAASAKFMKDAGFIAKEIDVTKVFTNKFVP
ncbi:MAG: ABC transporter substrate-binding protein [Chloroflexi bacterium]|nr:ABC transporter substrate-binding protein [Chloroflexota bacterium]